MGDNVRDHIMFALRSLLQDEESMPPPISKFS